MNLRAILIKSLVLILACRISTFLCGCSSNPQSETAAAVDQRSMPTLEIMDLDVIHPSDSSGVFLDKTINDFNDFGFEFGDSVDIMFSNGYSIEDVPYYNGFYGPAGSVLLVGYPGYHYIKACINYDGDLWDVANLSEGDTATVSLHEAGKYKLTQESLDLSYTDKREHYESDIVFANYRELSGGKLKTGIAYRAASPVSDARNRSKYVNDLAEENGVKFILDLSDDEDEISQFLKEDHRKNTDVSFFEKLHDSGNIAAINLSPNYRSESFSRKLSKGLVEMSEHEGPYLIHCIEGKDRTGFVCMLLEALCGATYEEVENDYMITYSNYYRIAIEDDPGKYNTVKEFNLDYMIRFIADADDDEDVRQIDLKQAAKTYLTGKCKMTEEQVEMLRKRLSE